MSLPCVVLELTEEGASADNFALRMALSLFAGFADVAIVPVDGVRPTPQLAEELAEVCAAMLPDAQLPELTLIERHEIPPDAQVCVRAGGTPDEQVQSTVLLVSTAMRLWETAPAETGTQDPGPTAFTPEQVAQFLRSRDGIIAQRDAMTPQSTRPVVVVIAQVQSTWGAVEGVCRALRESQLVDVEVVAVESEHENADLSTADFVRSQGFSPRNVEWLSRSVMNPKSGIVLALFYDPWDGLRPEVATASYLSEFGVRIAYIPYGNNVGAGDYIINAAYDLPMHRLSSRVYARSQVQRRAYASYCAVGDGAVRVMGLPKFDRIVTLPSRRRGETDVPSILWNPHFTTEAGGWSTFHLYLERVVEYARAHSDLNIVVRPHFRLWRDAALTGGQAASRMRALESAATTLPNVRVDRSADYLQSFADADALLSDASSLVSEFVLTGKPWMYLHRPDGPGLNEDSQYFFEGEVATSWPAVERFLERMRTGEPTDDGRYEAIRTTYFEHCDGFAAARIAADLIELIGAGDSRQIKGAR